MPTVEVFVSTNKFARAAARVQPLTDLCLDEVLDEVVLYAKAYAPVDTGYLRDHIERQGDTVVSLASYSTYQEYGTSRMQAQPFMRPAIQTAVPGVPRAFSGFDIKLLL